MVLEDHLYLEQPLWLQRYLQLLPDSLLIFIHLEDQKRDFHFYPYLHVVESVDPKNSKTAIG